MQIQKWARKGKYLIKISMKTNINYLLMERDISYLFCVSYMNFCTRTSVGTR